MIKTRYIEQQKRLDASYEYKDIRLSDILVIGEIRDKETMQAGIEMAESGHLVIGTLHTKSCAETIDRMINFYEVRDQASIKYLLSSVLKLVISQRLLPSKDGKLALLPEVMVVDNIVAGIIRKDKISVSEIEDAIQSGAEKGSIGIINSLAELFVDERITLEQAKSQIEEKNIEILNRTIMQLKIKKGRNKLRRKTYMPVFAYKAVTESGLVVKNKIEETNKHAVVKRLKEII